MIRDHLSFNSTGMMHPSSLQALLAQNSSVSFYLSFSSAGKRGAGKSVRNSKAQEGSRRKALDTLQTFIDEVSVKMLSLMKQMVEIQCRRPPRIEGLIFDSQSDNYRVRVAGFLRKKVIRSRVKAVNECIFNHALKLRECKVLGAILNQEGLATDDLTVSIIPDFFKIPERNSHSALRIAALEALRCHYLSSIAMIEKPLWVEDFDRFMLLLLQKAVRAMDPELVLCPHLEDEISLSRALFKSGLKQGLAIDCFIKRQNSENFTNFGPKITPFCLALIPFSEKLCNEGQAAGFLIMFRAVMNRIYELKPSVFRFRDGYWRIASAMGQMPVSAVVPEGIGPHGSAGNGVRDVFCNDPLFRKCSEWITCATFEVNPVDTLARIHTGCAILHQATLDKMMTYEEDGSKFRPLVGFDDLFSLLIGTFLASDLPDAYGLGRMVHMFNPAAYYSPVMDYTGANLEAFILHCKSQKRKMVAQ
jgi:hypothetical protein